MITGHEYRGSLYDTRCEWHRVLQHERASRSASSGGAGTTGVRRGTGCSSRDLSHMGQWATACFCTGAPKSKSGCRSACTTNRAVTAGSPCSRIEGSHPHAPSCSADGPAQSAVPLEIGVWPAGAIRDSSGRRAVHRDTLSKIRRPGSVSSTTRYRAGRLP